MVKQIASSFVTLNPLPVVRWLVSYSTQKIVAPNIPYFKLHGPPDNYHKASGVVTISPLTSRSAGVRRTPITMRAQDKGGPERRGNCSTIQRLTSYLLILLHNHQRT